MQKKIFIIDEKINEQKVNINKNVYHNIPRDRGFSGLNTTRNNKLYEKYLELGIVKYFL